jgi:hypothetical protein
MWKIEIDWKTRSPFLSVLTGDIRIANNITMGGINKNILPIPIKKEIGCTQYKNTTQLFSQCKTLIDVMVHSYFDGMKLSDHSYVWFNDCERNDNEVIIKMFD